MPTLDVTFDSKNEKIAATLSAPETLPASPYPERSVLSPENVQVSITGVLK